MCDASPQKHSDEPTLLGKIKFQAYSGLLVLNTGLWIHFQKQPFYHDDADELESYALMIVQVASSSQQCVVSVI